MVLVVERGEGAYGLVMHARETLLGLGRRELSSGTGNGNYVLAPVSLPGLSLGI